jgi:hypothetical protein
LNSWSFQPDQGQGFEAIEVYENSTGSWVLHTTLAYDTADVTLEMDGGVSIKLVLHTWLNSSLCGAGSSAEGKLYQRHNATISFTNGTQVYSLNNFTYLAADTGIDPPLWLYTYESVLNYNLGYGNYFVVDVTYEVYY